MIRRVLWMSVGVGATIYVLRKVNHINALTTRLTPQTMAAAVNSLAESLKAMTAELSAAMAEHEEKLTQTMLFDEPRPGAAPRHARRDDWQGEIVFDEGDPEEYF